MGARRQVIVLGSGAAGMAAALAAATAGADVTVLERAPLLGGTTAISGGGIWIPANPWAAAAGGGDDIESALAYVQALQLGDVDFALGEAYVRDGVEVALALERHAGVQWQHLVGMSDYHAERPGGSRLGRSLEIAPVEVSRAALARVRPDPYATPPWTINEEAGIPERPDADELERRHRQRLATRGRGFIAACYDALAAFDVEVRTAVGPSSLVTTQAAVSGVQVDGERLDGAVVIATGGFERDPQLVATFLRGPILAPAGPPTNAGEGLRMGMAAGAALGNMSEAWWCPAVQVDGEHIDGAPFARMLFLDLAKPGGIVVDRHGRRFGNEATNYNDFGRLLHDVHGADFDRPRIPSWFVFDADRHRRFPIGFQTAPEPDGAWLLRADSLPALAAATDLPAATLAETIETFHDGVITDADAFGRGTYIWDAFSSGGGEARPIEGPPYYAARVLPGCLGTKGGLRTDRYGRVRRADDDAVIDGLFAAGNAAANPFGCAYLGPGATIGPAVVFGWRAGETAAAG
jgi:3-oxosteroid 1-dehydrogenase